MDEPEFLNFLPTNIFSLHNYYRIFPKFIKRTQGWFPTTLFIPSYTMKAFDHYWVDTNQQSEMPWWYRYCYFIICLWRDIYLYFKSQYYIIGNNIKFRAIVVVYVLQAKFMKMRSLEHKHGKKLLIITIIINNITYISYIRYKCITI